MSKYEKIGEWIEISLARGYFDPDVGDWEKEIPVKRMYDLFHAFAEGAIIGNETWFGRYLFKVFPHLNRKRVRSIQYIKNEFGETEKRSIQQYVYFLGKKEDCMKSFFMNKTPKEVIKSRKLVLDKHFMIVWWGAYHESQPNFEKVKVDDLLQDFINFTGREVDRFDFIDHIRQLLPFLEFKRFGENGEWDYWIVLSKDVPVPSLDQFKVKMEIF